MYPVENPQGTFDSSAHGGLVRLAHVCYRACNTGLEMQPLATTKRVIVTPAVYPRLVESLHFDIQSTGQKSQGVSTLAGHRLALF